MTKVLDPRDWPDGYLNEVERFLSEDYLTPAGLSLYPKCFDSPWFFPLQRQAEMRRMIEIARGVQPRTVMEIGSDKGAGVYHWVKCLPTVQSIVACDTRGVPWIDAMQRAFRHVEFCARDESSYSPSTVSHVTTYLGTHKIDVLFIDGDKNRFVEDFDAYLPLMNPAGVVFMHDVNNDTPLAAYRSVVARGYEHEEIIDLTDTHAALDRARQGIPPSGAHEGWLRHWAGRSCGVGVIYLNKG